MESAHAGAGRVCSLTAGARGAPLTPAEPVTFAEVSGTWCVRVSVPTAAPSRSPCSPARAPAGRRHDTGLLLLNHSARGVAGLRRVPSAGAAVGSSAPRNVLLPVNTFIYNCGCGGGREGGQALVGSGCCCCWAVNSPGGQLDSDVSIGITALREGLLLQVGSQGSPALLPALSQG